MEVLLDTNFILSCIKQKLDFFSLANDIFDEKIDWLVPFEVLQELKDLSERKGEKIPDKESARVGLEFVRLIKAKEIHLGNKVVDNGIVDYVNNKKNKIIVATLDKALKKRLNSQILTIRDMGSLEII